jgi:hypothetical protein
MLSVLQIVMPVMQHVSQLVETDSERLSDYGSDRTYNIFQCLANTNLPRIIERGSDPQGMLLQVCIALDDDDSMQVKASSWLTVVGWSSLQPACPGCCVFALPPGCH